MTSNAMDTANMVHQFDIGDEVHPRSSLFLLGKIVKRDEFGFYLTWWEELHEEWGEGYSGPFGAHEMVLVKAREAEQE